MATPSHEVSRENPTPQKLKILPALPPALLLAIMMLINGHGPMVKDATATSQEFRGRVSNEGARENGHLPIEVPELDSLRETRHSSF